MKQKFENLPQSVDEMKDIIEISGIHASPYADWLRFLLFSLVAFVILLLLFFIFRYLYRKIKNRLIRISPEEKAETDLRDLIKKDFVRQGRLPFYYFRLDEIFRTYMKQKFNVDVLEKTFEELKQDLNPLKSYFSDSQMPDLLSFWERAQLAKFAKVGSSEQQSKVDYKFVREFVRRTKSQNEEGEAGKGKKIKKGRRKNLKKEMKKK